MSRIANVVCDYQNLIDPNMIDKKRLWNQATANDDSTMKYWRETWLKNIAANKAKYGTFKTSINSFFQKNLHGTAIIIGSGPSLKLNVLDLKEKKTIPTISALHNFHYLEDNGVGADYYITLDAGKITLEEISEGGQKTPDEYYEISKGRKLIAFIGTDPALLEKWKGEIFFYNAPIPSEEIAKEIDKIEKFNLFFASGGNVLGTCLYFARSILGCFNIIFIGADFSFGYPDIVDGKPFYSFHPWKSKYDNQLGQYITVTNIFGHKIPTWASYYNFKCYFDVVSKYNNFANFINATEGGCFGSYPEGNIASMKYMSLKDAIQMFNMSEILRESVENPNGIDIKRTLFV